MSKIHLIDNFRELIENGLHKNEIMKKLNISERTYYRWKKKINYEKPNPPTLNRAIDDIIKTKKEIFEYEKNKELYYNGIPIKFKEDKKIGIIFMGDPHLDNPKTDLELFEKHMKLAKETDDVYLIGLGDYLDNWVGYLSKLFSEHHITQDEALAIIKYYFEDVHFLAAIVGNHDKWNLFEIYFREIIGEDTIIGDEIRLKLQFPSNEFTIRMRHSFSGRSQYNPAFPAVKQAIFNLPDDIICMGHTHQLGYQIWPQPYRKLSHCFVVGSYKRYDEYAKKFMTHDTNLSPAVFAIVDPKDKSLDNIKIFFDVEKGIEFFKKIKD